MSKIIDEPETENWSDKKLVIAFTDCGNTFGRWALFSGVVGNKYIYYY